MTQMEIAATVCEQCMRRKKSCNKSLPRCARCARLGTRCSYSDPNSTGQNRPSIGAPPVLPPISDANSEVGGSSFPPRQFWAQGQENRSIEAELQAHVLSFLARSGSSLDEVLTTYFQTFHRSLPILSQESFYLQLRSYLCGDLEPDSHFALLLLAIFLITHLSSTSQGSLEDGARLYREVKRIWALLQGKKSVTLEIVQVGCILASWEHTQDAGQEAWLTIGTCARIGYILGLHISVKAELPSEENSEDWEMRRCVWWGIVVLEHIISSEYPPSALPFASGELALDMFLPLSHSEKTYRLCEDLITPIQSTISLFPRPFTKLGNFPSTIQATYLSSLVTTHINHEYPSHEARREAAGRLDAALESFGSTLIPPPGCAEGVYCGAYWMRTSAAFSLHAHYLAIETSLQNTEGIQRATLALQSLARIVIHMTRSTDIGRPLDFDTLAFWSHEIVFRGAMTHLKLGIRDENFEEDLEVCNDYLKLFSPRYGVHGRYLRELEGAEIEMKVGKQNQNPRMDVDIPGLETIIKGAYDAALSQV